MNVVISGGQPRLRLSLLDRNGGHQRAVDVSGPTRNISSVVWLADNRTVVFTRGERAAPVKAELVLHDTKTQLQRTIAWQCCSFSLDTMGSERLVFDSEATRSGLLQVSEGGRKQRWLSQANSADRQPVYSPDGKRLAFASNRNGKINIWQILLTTGAVSRLTEGSPTDYDPAFTPDGNRLIFSSDRTGHFEIYIANADGSNTKQVTHDGSDDENATMTADGQWIVYSHRAQESGIWKIHPDGTGATPILRCNCFNPEVSPDGRYALYLTSPRPDLTEIHVLRISDGSVTPFVIPCQLHRRTGITIGRARWIASEPRGIPKAIAFIGQDERGVTGVYIQAFDSGRDNTNTRRQLFLLNPRVPFETFGISPDGQSSVLSVIDDTSVIMLASHVPGINAVALK
jgi:dipeptidyl aminopeptidase/acylaminoacyl peptidase